MLENRSDKRVRDKRMNLSTISLTSEEITAKRAEITKRFLAHSANIRTPQITRISVLDLRFLFELYDEVFLQSYFKNQFPGMIKFSLSPRLTRSAGKTLCPKNIGKMKPQDVVIEIRMGLSFFFKYDEINSAKVVCGLPTANSLEAFQLVFEHELCHVLEFLVFHSSSCAQKRFKTIARQLFGHTESYHKLPTQSAIAQEKFGLKIGDTVSFSFEGETKRGVLYRINKRATIMVHDRKGVYVDKKGNRYAKYYVPLRYLEKDS